jgi:serine/threonine-protein kinase
VGGAVTGEIEVAEVDKPVVRQSFTLITEQHPLAGAMGTGSLGLFAVAYVESGLRTLRRGHRRPSVRVTAIPLGALFGLALWVFMSVLTTHELSPLYGPACGTAGSIAALCIVFATERSARY